MLKAMRKNVKSLAPTLWIVIAAFVVAIFAVWGGAGRLGEEARSEVIATMGKDKLSLDDYFLTLRQRLEAMQREFKELNKQFIQQLNIPQQVLEQLIQQSLLAQKAREMGITASDQEVRDKITSLFQRDGKFIGFQEYRQILDYNRTSLADFESGIKKEIILNKLIRLITAGITVTPEELWENYRKQNESAKIEFLVLAEGKITDLPSPAEAEIQAYFENHKSSYQLPERREGAYLFVSNEDIRKEVKVGDSDIEKYYKDNLDQFKQRAKIRVSRILLALGSKTKDVLDKETQGILDRISGGGDFAQLARAHSADDKAKDGGDWGYDEWRTLSSNEREEIEQLEAGSVSGIIALPDGNVILKVTEKEPETTQPFEEVRLRIQGILEDQKARELAGEKIAALERAARREKSLDVAAQKAGLKVRNTGLLKAGQALEDFDPSGSISQALFGLKEKEISAPVSTFNGTGIAQLEKIEAPRQANLEEVRAEVEKDLEVSRKKERILARLGEARAKLEGKDWEDMASRLGLEFQTVAEHKKEQYLPTIGENQEMDQLSFSLPLNQASEPVGYAGGYAVMRVLERKEASREGFEKNKETERTNYLETKKNRFLQAFLDKLREQKEVKVNYNLFAQVNADILSRFDRTE
jgi:peptidyl-prolyl cis-trans isomerase D